MKNFITLLKELADKDLSCVKYEELPRTLNGSFTIKCTLKSKSFSGSGLTKKRAKHKAAEGLYLELSGKSSDANLANIVPLDSSIRFLASNVSEDDVALGNPVSELQELCSRFSLKAPVYKCVSEVGEPHNKLFMFRCNVGDLSVEKLAPTKKLAKRLVAKEVLSKMKTAHEEGSLNPSLKIVRTVDINSIETKNKVIQRLREGDHFRRINKNIGRGENTISSQCFIFLSGHYPKSSTIQKVVKSENYDDEFGIGWVSVNIANTIFDELNLKYDYSSIPSNVPDKCLISLHVKCSSESNEHLNCPQWSFLGHGENESIAKEKAAHSWIEFVKKMIFKSDEMNSVEQSL